MSTYTKPTLFISDVHLGGFSEDENNRIEAELIQLLNYCQRNDISIALLGDLFDYWMEYPDQIPALGRKLLDRFESFNEQLGPTLYITGNHDNWTREHLPDRGFDIEKEYRTLNVGDKEIMLLHGDGLADDNFGLRRPLLHKILRNSTFVSLYQKIFPPKAGITLMKYFSRFTRLIDQNEKAEKIQKLNAWTEKLLRESRLDMVICGHDHHPRKIEYDFGTYINLGTFYRHRTMGFYNNDTVSLVKWHPGRQTLINYSKQ